MTTLVSVAPASVIGDGAVERPERDLAAWIPVFLGWFTSVRGRSENTIRAYHRDLLTFAGFAEAHGLRFPRHVTFQAVEAYMAHLMRQRGCQAVTANRHRYALGQLFKFLRRQGVVASNPVEDTFSLKTPKRLPDYWTVPVQEQLLAHLADSESLDGRRDYALVATGFFVGLRVSELVILRVDHVDLDTGRLRVIGKGDKERECVIIPRLAAILRDYVTHVRPQLVSVPVQGFLKRQPLGRRWGRRIWHMYVQLHGKGQYLGSTGTDDEAEARAILADRVRDLRRTQESPYLFVNAHHTGGHTQARAGQPLLTRSVYAMLRRRLSAIAGERVNPHKLRHSFASRLRENGAPLELIQEAMGHENISTTLIYAHISTKKQQEDIAKYLEGTA